MPNLRTETFEDDPNRDVPDGFERVTWRGLECLVCGATIHNTGGLLKRHRDWHTDLEQRLSGR